MTNKDNKAVLIVDDERLMAEILRDGFLDCNEWAECPYQFEVDVVFSAAECVEKIRKKKEGYSVIVLDVRMEEARSGLEVAARIQQGDEPIRIIFTGYPKIGECVEAMRSGAWDYIVKEDVGAIQAAQVVMNSALARLRQLDLRREQEQRISADWLPRHLDKLQEEHGGQVVALWHQPEVAPIASGQDVFELDAALKGWREEHAEWETPYIVLIPPPRHRTETQV